MSSAKTDAKVVHEVDTQRHHVRIQIPAKLEIAGVEYPTLDWSTAGVRLEIGKGRAANSLFDRKKVYDARLLLKFDNYDLSLPLKVEVVYVDPDKRCTGMRYVDLNQGQVSILQHLVGSYITGELTSVGDLIHVTGRNNFTKPRQVPKKDDEGFFAALARFNRRLAVLAVSLLLLGYVAFGIFEQVYVVDAQNAIVSAEGIALRAPSGGVVNYSAVHNGDKVGKGHVLASVISKTGIVASIDSPCDCIVKERLSSSGDEVSKQQPIITLIPEDAKQHIEAYVSYEDAIRLSKGQTAHVSLAGSRLKTTGVVSNILAKESDSARVKLLIEPKRQIPAELIGLPVQVKINTFNLGK